MDHKSGKWASQVIDLQKEDGSWGCFHTLSNPTKSQPISTEQALRRLQALGFTREDEPVAKVLTYMRDCLAGKYHPPDNREAVLNWDAFESHMLATWILRFVPNDAEALPIARLWAEIVTAAFQGGYFDEKVYECEYRKRIPKLHSRERLIALSQFYMVSILKGRLDPETEGRFLDHIIHNDGGIYYVYGLKIASLPETLAARKTRDYIAALEQLAGYSCAGEKLGFAVDWLNANRDAAGLWDLGAKAKDGIHLPLSDSWRKEEDRKADCTERITSLLRKLGA